jgi:hypothetical protein
VQYTYEIASILPKQEFMTAIYRSEGQPDFYKNFNPKTFEEQAIKDLITGFAPFVVEHWERLQSHPESVDFSLEGSDSAEAPVIEEVPFNNPPTIEEPPAYDPFTQRIELDLIEDPNQATVGFTVYELTDQEQADYLAAWRAYTAVTMRQCRLVLLQQGLLETVNSNVSSLSEAAQVEWEYAAIVTRSSSLVESLAAPLNLSEVQLDELFKLAATL